jgi:hypothetical protein
MARALVRALCDHRHVAVFLHIPVRTPERVLELVRSSAEEGTYLEFKPTLNRADAEKEAAAFANGLGGDLIVGVHAPRDPDSGRDRAQAFTGATLPQSAEKDVRQGLRDHLAPREVVDTIEVRVLRADDAGQQRQVLVVNVPPWPHGSVAWQSEQDVQQAVFRFPVRLDAQTRYKSFEELLRMNDGQRRSIYLRLRELTDPSTSRPNTGFILVSPVLTRSGVIEAEPRIDGVINEVTQDYVLVHMQERQLVFHLEEKMAGVKDIPQSPFVIPLELIIAAWRFPDQPDRLGLALSAAVLWDGRKWTFDMGRGSRS